MLPLPPRISASNGVSTFPTTSTVSGLPQGSCVILSVTSHLETMFVERFLSLISVSFTQLLKQEQTSSECLGWVLLISSLVWKRLLDQW